MMPDRMLSGPDLLPASGQRVGHWPQPSQRVGTPLGCWRGQQDFSDWIYPVSFLEENEKGKKKRHTELGQRPN